MLEKTISTNIFERFVVTSLSCRNTLPDITGTSTREEDFSVRGPVLYHTILNHVLAIHFFFFFQANSCFMVAVVAVEIKIVLSILLDNWGLF